VYVYVYRFAGYVYVSGPSQRSFEKPIGAKLKALRLRMGRPRAEAQRGNGEGCLRG